ncbi:MAG: hypothetical protein KVP17_002481 [Porospora cf. gigantea B]|uniref:uncharacterized protein n=1 Tax=Porospora cf. gigantea B TaxID=2853592 RepID=UPI00357185B1|nr:MAG: hypothetical protein KVP17_002481 [Porospora cf. gigantea B]
MDNGMCPPRRKQMSRPRGRPKLPREGANHEAKSGEGDGGDDDAPRGRKGRRNRRGGSRRPARNKSDPPKVANILEISADRRTGVLDGYEVQFPSGYFDNPPDSEERLAQWSSAVPVVPQPRDKVQRPIRTREPSPPREPSRSSSSPTVPREWHRTIDRDLPTVGLQRPSAKTWFLVGYLAGHLTVIDPATRDRAIRSLSAPCQGGAPTFYTWDLLAARSFFRLVRQGPVTLLDLHSVRLLRGGFYRELAGCCQDRLLSLAAFYKGTLCPFEPIPRDEISSFLSQIQTGGDSPEDQLFASSVAVVRSLRTHAGLEKLDQLLELCLDHAAKTSRNASVVAALLFYCFLDVSRSELPFTITQVPFGDVPVRGNTRTIDDVWPWNRIPTNGSMSYVPMLAVASLFTWIDRLEMLLTANSCPELQSALLVTLTHLRQQHHLSQRVGSVRGRLGGLLALSTAALQAFSRKQVETALAFRLPEDFLLYSVWMRDNCPLSLDFPNRPSFPSYEKLISGVVYADMEWRWALWAEDLSPYPELTRLLRLITVCQSFGHLSGEISAYLPRACEQRKQPPPVKGLIMFPTALEPDRGARAEVAEGTRTSRGARRRELERAETPETLRPVVVDVADLASHGTTGVSSAAEWFNQRKRTVHCCGTSDWIHGMALAE